MGRLVSCQLIIGFYIFALLVAGGCASNGQSSRTGLGDTPSPGYGWWVGRTGRTGAVDIGFKGRGLQIEVVRTFLPRANINSPVGLRWIHNYLMYIGNASDTQLRLFDEDGSESIFTKTGAGTFTAEDDRVLQQHGDGTLSLLSDKESVARFNWKGRLTHIQGTQYANTISLAYGGDGYLESISDAEGHVITFYYDPETHRLTSIRDGNGRSVNYKHDDVGHLMTVKNAEGLTSEYTYDRNNRLASVTFP